VEAVRHERVASGGKGRPAAAPPPTAAEEHAPVEVEALHEEVRRLHQVRRKFSKLFFNTPYFTVEVIFNVIIVFFLII